ncbi:MAG: PAS domain S-box protein [Patescibacteria group bacterium]|nr:PAS domain S-box protein [Patescibacteria group bacterium]
MDSPIQETPEGHQLYKELFENINIGLYTSTPEGKILDANPALIRMSEAKSKDELLAHNIGEVYQDPATRKYVVERIKKQGFIKDEILPLVTLRGKKVWALTTVVARKGNDGKTYFDGVTEDVTERENLRRELVESEKKYRQLFENSSMAIFVTTPGPQGKFIDANPAALELFGVSSIDELGKHSPSDLYPNPEDRKRISDKIERQGFIKNEEMQLRNFKGTDFWILSSVKVQKDDDGNQYFYGTFFDITDRRQAEDRLRESEVVLRKSQEIARLGDWTFDILHNKIEGSDELYHIFGLKKGEFDGNLEKLIAKTIHPDDRVRVTKSIANFVLTGQMENMEYRSLLPDGSVHVMWAKPFDLIRGVGGVPVRLSGILQDITEQRSMETRLHESEVVLKRSQEAAKLGSWTLDVSRRELRASDETRAILGVEKQEKPLTLEMFLNTFVYPDDRPMVQDRFVKYAKAASGNPPAIEYRIVRADGDVRYVSVNPYDIARDASGKPLSINGTMQDITNRKQIELDLQEKVDELERMNQLMIGREVRMSELKRELAELKEQMNQK